MAGLPTWPTQYVVYGDSYLATPFIRFGQALKNGVAIQDRDGV
jgi:hypothetical protein